MFYWLNKRWSYKQFVQNSVNKSDDINWQYVPTREHPAEVGSRESLLTKVLEIWWRGPSWLQVKEKWPMQTDKKPSVESEKRLKILKEHKSIVITAIEIQDDFCLILYKSDSQKGF